MGTARTGPWPTFLILGAPKAGTTALYHWLGQHPEVYVSPVKQPHFFAGLEPRFRGPGDEALNRELVTSEAAYLRLFQGSEGARARGEASPFYLFYAERAVPRIRRQLPECRLVVLLRDPVERAWSGYLHLVRDGRETLAFGEALAREAERRALGWEPLWYHRALGQYAEQLEVVLGAFPQGQVGVWLYDEMRDRPLGFFQEVCRFLGVRDDFRPQFTRHNQSGVPRSPLLHALLVRLRAPHLAKALLPEPVAQWVVRHYLVRRPPPEAEARELAASFQDGLRRLQALLPDKDLRPWAARWSLAAAG